jgi:hypothetical protein
MEAVSETGVFLPIEGNELLERRSHERYEIRQGAIASLHLTVIGYAINISRGGLAFRYVASRDRSSEWSILKISTTDQTFNLGMIPVEVVRDVPIPESFTTGAISLRSCGLKFGDLQDYQEFALRYFIQNYGVPDSKNC